MKRLLVTGLGVFLTSCATLQSVSMTQIPAERKNPVTATASKMLILGISFDNDYAESVAEQLKNQCRGGQVKGILTKDENFNYFLGIVMKRQITASGYCLKG
jgi:hypothetical protein